ncbi:response regulator transcription factor [Desulfosporosinus shakirovi]|uniref:response regulator transcription factor n=1 Tax=Desulfosporosinus shakirovi TaxID=2885154 RepID=UPI001E644C50|nr:response regulator transcription factor [Desulfosporosinus sp. SRJS8]MCB8818589.1 response regulator transcription factor [Desulfosporosinus sp. SRJS8]
MEIWILEVNNNPSNFEAAQKEWLKHHVFIKMVKSMPEALNLLTKIDFLLVVIIADSVEYLPHLKLMRDMKPMPILVLSPKYNASEKVEAIQLGADEYLAYPSTAEEIVASGRAMIRRYTVLNHQVEKPITIITYHEISVCVEYRKLFLKSREIELTRKEFDLLHLLFSSIGRVYTYEQIYRHVWAEEMESVSGNYAVWCLVARVRKKLRSVQDTLEYIKTVRDVGYCIDMALEQVL